MRTMDKKKYLAPATVTITVAHQLLSGSPGGAPSATFMDDPDLGEVDE